MEGDQSGPPEPVWVTHTPTPDNITDDGDNSSTGRTSSTPPYAEKEDNKGSMKERLKTFIPQSWGGIIHKWTKESDSLNDSEASISKIQILPNGSRVSPPVSPLRERRNCNESLGNSSQNSHRPLLRESPSDDILYEGLREESLLTSIHPAEYYAEKLEVYNQKYSYLKSWPGLLRLLAGLQLLFGGMVFACIIAYIQKDSEWSNSYGLYNGMAGTAFIFINMAMYLGSFLVCLKMWRHEAAQREKEYFENKVQVVNPMLSLDKGKSHLIYTVCHVLMFPKILPYRKYPGISCVEEKEKYKAVFNDQYQEYKDLHRDIGITLDKFRQLDAMMARLLRDGKSQEQRIQSVLKKYQRKKSDPGFLEKKERCDYLKAKLSHIKNKIRIFDQEAMEDGRT
uniref:MARVEL domain containing 2-like n=1 Tax=Cyclopterus lumpus TaxID=8103 RepID=A0A8C2ZPT1_CYCLU